MILFVFHLKQYLHSFFVSQSVVEGFSLRVSPKTIFTFIFVSQSAVEGFSLRRRSE
jgi:hypothetical protein